MNSLFRNIIYKSLLIMAFVIVGDLGIAANKLHHMFSIGPSNVTNVDSEEFPQSAFRDNLNNNHENLPIENEEEDSEEESEQENKKLKSKKTFQLIKQTFDSNYFISVLSTDSEEITLESDLIIEESVHIREAFSLSRKLYILIEVFRI